MRSLNRMLLTMLVLSLITFISYLLSGEVIFSLVILSFSMVFLFGFREYGTANYSFRIAHLYVGSILFSIAAGYVLLAYLISFSNLIIGEEVYKLSLADAILFITGIYSVINVIYIKKTALRTDVGIQKSEKGSCCS
ncbi:MAG: hypothetical protein ACUVQF_08475 [Fervidobacterium sp.]|uniref:hypothetical protein n=1 Tax=Fervidobacterium sp. TaxID=1871331 RepID=UPI004049ACB2